MTGQCGEQPLQPFGACLLGSFNLVKYLRMTGLPHDGAEIALYRFDTEAFKRDIAPVVRAMDNVVDASSYPLEEQEREAKAKRRMGLGVTGASNAIEAIGFPYGSSEFVAILRLILATLRDECYRASVEVAKEKGPFPAFTQDYLASEFVQQLPQDLQEDIARHGIRNSHLTSIAPTGTISLCADNVSSGIEPVAFYETSRVMRTFEGDKTVKIEDYGKKFLGVTGKTIADVSVQEHLNVLATAQEYVDSAVSKTVNVPTDYPWADFKMVYERAWETGCKGITTYRLGGKREAILSDASCTIDPETGHRECSD